MRNQLQTAAPLTYNRLKSRTLENVDLQNGRTSPHAWRIRKLKIEHEILNNFFREKTTDFSEICVEKIDFEFGPRLPKMAKN